MKQNPSFGFDSTHYLYANGGLPAGELGEIYGRPWASANAEWWLQADEPIEGALAATLFKLGIISRFKPLAGTTLRVLSSDVEFHNAEGKSQHRLDRQSLDEKVVQQAKVELVAAYTQGSFSVTWILTYATQVAVRGDGVDNVRF